MLATTRRDGRSGYALAFKIAFAPMFAACGAQVVAFDVPPAPDASTDGTVGRDGTVSTDTSPPADVARVDRVVGDTPTTGRLFSHCRTASECGSPGAQCLDVFPSGLCTMRCTSDRACGPDGVCEQNAGVCFPRCTAGGLECDRFGAACYPFDASGTLGCYPSCFPPDTTPPAGYPSCEATGQLCDPNMLVCTASPSAGSQVGEPCGMDPDCASGRCQAEIDPTGLPTGFIGGYCIAIGRVPQPSEYVAGGPIPRSNCPAGTGALPAGETSDEGGPAACLRTCNGDAECRPGYHCDRFGMFSNGVCIPIDCSAGLMCPAGYVCSMDPNGNPPVCAQAS